MNTHASSKAVVSGSFDPITKGHLYVIEQARKMADMVIVLVAHNPEKRYRFSLDERTRIIEASIREALGDADGVSVQALPNGQFTATVAKQLGAHLVVRGLRNVVDFEYEHSQQLINSAIEPEVATVFVMPPTDLIAVSSSAIKGMSGIDGWEAVAAKYVPEAALRALRGEAVE